MKNFKWFRRMLGGTWYQQIYQSYEFIDGIGPVEQDVVIWNKGGVGKKTEVYPEYKSFVCWFSWNIWDIHDYPKSKGGDGTPSHFYTYNCHMCKKEFTI